jgi:hypothetical protein
VRNVCNGYVANGSQLQFVTELHEIPLLNFTSQNLTTNTVTFSISSSLSLQITASRHAIKSNGGVGVAAVGISFSDILVMVGDPASKSGNTVSCGMQV